ncbi:glycosyltransferase involved in cell wall biosynthesis [Motilibacter rhizosphaerae]|uniref:Glycosyltransferase involved in cell wall biosynthesis n=1 Tax=Motilibacter rhizosphaerae TaxID=598652 RepID=A0A4Q7NWN7_9ACTN|nr:glycosyltransferase [Motilibacter rhizosphaerae]RZS91604.1 glycosyltransferase involved in cell wall biosynthesis [Motilibacter rhizosphaerae]
MNERPLRVLQVAARYLPDLGGIETHVHEVSKRLAARDDLDITVAATDRTGSRARDERVEGFRVLRTRAWPAQRDYYFAPGLVRLIRKGDWDVVHVQGIHTLVPVLAMAAARRAGIPYVVTFHTGGSSAGHRNAARGIQWRLLAPLLRDAAALVGVSRSEQRLFAEATGLPLTRIRVIRNGGALPEPVEGVAVVPGKIVSSGRLERYKGHHRVIEALPLVQQRIPGAFLEILGAGPYEAELRALAERLGVQDSVTIRHLPPGDREGMARALATSAVFAALSDYEAHPVAVMEALTLGVPVVGTDTAGVADLVEDGLVRGVAPGARAEDVADVLASVLASTGQTAASAPPLLPTWDGAAGSLASLYAEVDRGRWSGAAPAQRTPPRAGATRVVHVVPGLAPGGAEKQIEYLVERGTSHATAVCLYLLGQVGQGMVERGDDVRLLGMTGWRKLTAVVRLARLLRAERADVVHVHLLSGQLFGILAARLARVPAIVSTEHSIMTATIEGRARTPQLAALYRALAALAHRTIAVSPTTAQRIAEWHIAEERVVVIDNGVDFEALAFDSAVRDEVRRELGLADEGRVVGAVGRLDPVKRFESLLDALAPMVRAAEDSPAPIDIVIAGHGPLQARLTSLAEELGISKRLHLLGPRNDVPRLLNAFDVFVSPSRDETFGISIIEALGNGLPTVYSQCPAIDDEGPPPAHARHLPETGSEQEELRALADAVDELLGTARRPVPEELLARYSVPALVARTESLYAELLRGRRA